MKPSAEPESQRNKSQRLLREAIHRIIQCCPESPELKARLKARKQLRLCVQTVAIESGFSRTAIYKFYPEVLSEIMAQIKKKAVRTVPVSQQTETTLREEIARLDGLLKDSLSDKATLVYRLQVAEDRLKRQTPQSPRRTTSW